MLSGEDARAAAVEAGVIEPGDDLPNDMFVVDAGTPNERLTVAPDATVHVWDCTTGCELRAVSLADFLRGDADPFGGDSALWDVTIRAGVIADLSEVYAP